MLLNCKKNKAPAPLIWFDSGNLSIKIVFGFMLLRNHVPSLSQAIKMQQFKELLKKYSKCIVVCGSSLTDEECQFFTQQSNIKKIFILKEIQASGNLLKENYPKIIEVFDNF